MKDYYETKKARYEYILAALDTKIEKDLKAVATTTLDELIDFLLDLKGTRELITNEIEYLDDALSKLKAEEAVKAAEQAAETEAE